MPLPGMDAVPDYWDAIFLFGDFLPGVVHVRVKHGARLDRKKAPGKNGATFTVLGKEPARVELRWLMWTEEHVRAYEKLVGRLINTQKTDDPTAVDVDHPTLTAIGVRKLVFLDGTGIERKSPADPASVTLSFLEYVPKPPKTGVGTVKKSKSLARPNALTQSIEQQREAARPSLDRVMVGPDLFAIEP